MQTITKELLVDLVKATEGDTISIYMPTFVTGRETQQNPIRLKNLISQAEDQLSEQGMSQGERSSYLAPLSDLLSDAGFWQEQNEGLALFLDSSQLRIFRLPMRFEEAVEVGDTFHIKPLVPLFQGNGLFYLLSLDQERPKLFVGTKFKLMRVDEVDFPNSLQDMFDQYYEFHSHLQFHTKTSAQAPGEGGDRQGMHFGQGGEDIDEKAEILNYFHRFDDALMEYLNGEDAPLVLAGAEYLHPLFKEAASYPHLLEIGITKDVSQMTPEKMHEQAWKIVKHQYDADKEQALGVFRSLRENEGEIAISIEEIISSAYFKRIHTLFVAEDENIYGSFDPQKMEVNIEEKPAHHNNDLLNMAVVHTIINGGNVLVMPKDEFPGSQPAAAILRY